MIIAFHSPFIKADNKTTFVGAGGNLLNFTATQNKASNILTSSPIIVILGKRLNSDAQMLCCASLSASVCRSLAPVCADTHTGSRKGELISEYSFRSPQ